MADAADERSTPPWTTARELRSRLGRAGALDACSAGSGGWGARFAALPDAVTVRSEPFHAMVSIRPKSGTDRADPGTCGTGGALERLLGAPLPAPNAWTGGARITAVRLGPDEVLLTSPFLAPRELEGAARDAGATATDVSAQRTTIRLRGARARDVLETGCAIDLHPRAFGPGSAAVTLLGRAGVVLLGVGEGDYRILVRSSFAGYLAEWLLDAATEHLP